MRARAMMGIGEGTGEHRAADAAQKAIASPLLETTIEGARGVIFNITGGPDMAMYEVNEAAEMISRAVDSGRADHLRRIDRSDDGRQGPRDGSGGWIWKPPDRECGGRSVQFCRWRVREGVAHQHGRHRGSRLPAISQLRARSHRLRGRKRPSAARKEPALRQALFAYSPFEEALTTLVATSDRVVMP